MVIFSFCCSIFESIVCVLEHVAAFYLGDHREACLKKNRSRKQHVQSCDPTEKVITNSTPPLQKINREFPGVLRRSGGPRQDFKLAFTKTKVDNLGVEIAQCFTQAFRVHI